MSKNFNCSTRYNWKYPITKNYTTGELIENVNLTLNKFLTNRKGYLSSLHDCVKKKIKLFYNYLYIIFFSFFTNTYMAVISSWSVIFSQSHCYYFTKKLIIYQDFSHYNQSLSRNFLENESKINFWIRNLNLLLQ